ncbi:UNVERIFIED_CONTAM: hypothetical protein RMT77_011348 [Armadillidium vulgare]
MTKKFPNIEFNLSCDTIRYNNEMESLKIHSLNLHIGRIFKDVFKSEYGKELLINKRLQIDFYKELLHIEKFIDDVLETEIDPLMVTPSLRKAKLHFMTIQILNFLNKYPYLHIESPEIFFPYVVFTSQGTINTMKSIKLLRNAYPEKDFTSFQLTCCLCFEEQFKFHFEYLPDDVKEKVVSEMKNDFFFNFYIRETRIDHPLIGKTFKGYLRDKYYNSTELFFNAINTKNEIAVEYLWRNKVSQLEGSCKIFETELERIVGDSLKTNIMMFLLFQVNENELEEFFRKFSFQVIEKVVKGVRFLCVFEKIFDVLKIYLNSESISKIFDILGDPHCKDCLAGINLDLVVNYFSSLSESNKIYIVKKSTQNPNNSLSHSIQEDKNPYKNVLWKIITSDRKDYLKKMLKIEDAIALRDFFISKPGDDLISDAVKIEKLYYIYDVIRMVSNEEVLNDIYHHLLDI